MANDQIRFDDDAAYDQDGGVG
jgi:hypothetical protein